MSKNETRIFAILWFGLAALLIGMILAAPVMREPANGTMSATEYFGEAR